MSNLHLTFMGTPAFAVPALEAIISAGHDVDMVYTQPPRRTGRSQRVQVTPVHKLADRHHFPIRYPESLRTEDAQRTFIDMHLDVAVVVAYGLILPKAILEAPRFGCLNIHASLLPRWRGAAPIQRAIMAGDEETGISIMQMDEGLDTGPILLEEPVPIPQRTTAKNLHDDLAHLGARLIVEALNGVGSGSLVPTGQSDVGVTYAEKLTKEDGRIDWSRDAGDLDRRVRAFNPWPGCFFELQSENIKLLRSVPTFPDHNATPGTLLGEDGIVACGTGALKLLTVQRPGRRPVNMSDFLRSLRLEPGTVLS